MPRAAPGEEVKRTAEECNIAADRLAACQTADGLVDNRLENGGGTDPLWLRLR